jgi:hypothetical protein
LTAGHLTAGHLTAGHLTAGHLTAGSLIRFCNFSTSFLIVNAPPNRTNVSANETSGTT